MTVLRSTGPLLRALGNALRILVKRQGEKTPFGNRLREEDFRLNKVGRGAYAALRRRRLPMGDNGLPRLVVFFQKAVEDGFSCTETALEQKLQAFQKERPICNSEWEVLSPLLQTSLLLSIASIDPMSPDACARLEHGLSLLARSGDICFSEMTERCSPLHRLLCRDPAGVYPAQDEPSRALYRRWVASAAEKTGREELALAESILWEAKRTKQHIGFPLYARYKKSRPRNPFRERYLPLTLLFPAALAFLGAALCGQAWLALLLYLPAVAAWQPVAQWLALLWQEEFRPPRMDFGGLVPPNCRTLMTLCTLMPETDELTDLSRRVTRMLLQNPGPSIGLCLLCDRKAASTPVISTDRARLEALTGLVDELNRQYGNRILLVVRKRKYSMTQHCYCGSERKRGAINTLVGLLQGETPSDAQVFGNRDYLQNIQYLLTLDADTETERETVSMLTSVAAHPLHRPVIDPKKGIVTAGYGIIAPRMTPSLTSSFRTLFALFFGGVGGTSAYDALVGQTDQTVFGQSVFSGKGLIDVAAYAKLLPTRFPPETVLSHDVMEGGILRTLFVGDIELLDGFPAKAMGFFKRLHRWERGDVQNGVFLLPKPPILSFQKENPLPPMVKYQLFENLRRTVTPGVLLGCLGVAMWLGNPASGWLCLAVLLAHVGDSLFGLVRTLFTGSVSFFTTRFYSGLLPGAVFLSLSALFRLALLPQFSYVGQDAAVRGLWRRLISHNNMLEWVTAAQVEGERTAWLKSFLYFWPQLVNGLLLLWLGNGLTQTFGLLFLMGLPLLYLLEKSPIRRQTIPVGERELLRGQMEQMLAFYLDYATEKENFLPPDNVQFSPVYRVAHRTSPTNIGLMLLSYLSGADCGILDREQLLTLTQNTVNTLHRLPKWEGNLYNWYDTKTLSVLPPAYVSTVDSGNFLCCMTAVRSGLLAHGEGDPRFTALAAEIDTLLLQTKLAPLYDEKKKLFYLGCDTTRGDCSGPHYDLLMSEERMTSYYAIATGQVPPRHWGALSRSLSDLKTRVCPLSWTGSMFEYYMPLLLLPMYHGSLSYEALHACLDSQRRYARRLKVPYGISESGIYAFDAELNYQYSPAGVQPLAMKPGMDSALVIAPYATFLTLPADWKGGVQNLKRLFRAGMTGRYGCYEAMDYTESRVGRSGPGLVKSYMAHHVGMSIGAVNNTLNGNILQKYFLEDPRMQTASYLLQEKIQVGEFMFQTLLQNNQRPSTGKRERKPEPTGRLRAEQPQIRLLGSGEVSAVLCDTGASFLKTHNTDLLRRPVDLLRDPKGSFCFLAYGGQITSATFAPCYRNPQNYETFFSEDGVWYFMTDRTLRCETEVRLFSRFPGEQRTVTLQNRTGETLPVTLLFYLEPCLLPHADDRAHPAFSKLFLSVNYEETTGIATVCRKPRDRETPYALAVGLLEEEKPEFEAARGSLFARTEPQIPKKQAFTAPFTGGSGVPDPVLALRLTITLSKNEKRTLRLATVMAATAGEAREQLLRLRAGRLLPDYTCTRFTESSLEGRVAQGLLPQLLFGKRNSKTHLAAVSKNTLPVQALWAHGVSGDDPIVTVEVRSVGETQRIEAYVRCHTLLKLCFLPFDLVFLYDQAPEIAEAIKQAVDRYGSMSELSARTGIHIINSGTLSPEETHLFSAVACHLAGRNMTHLDLPGPVYRPLTVLPVEPVLPAGIPSCRVEGGEFHGESFFVTGTPRVPWCHVLANPTFGTLLSDRALGYTWAINARENKLTPWFNDPVRDNTGEQLLFHTGSGCYDLVKGSTAEFSPAYAKYRGETAAFQTVTLVTVPARGMCKTLSVTLKNLSGQTVNGTLAYYTEPVLGVDRSRSAKLTGGVEDGMLLLENRLASGLGGVMGLWADRPFHPCCDRFSFWCGEWERETPLPVYDSCGTLCVPLSLRPGEETAVTFRMAYAATPETVRRLLTIPQPPPYKMSNSLTVKTDRPEVDLLVNTWLPWQTVAGRLFARTGFYQCGGAYGFRDQLQDACSLLLRAPELTKRQLLRCCAVQFEEGDVMHWWHALPRHAGGTKGVRTRSSDDLVWLPYGVAEYLAQTGDLSFLKIKVYYLNAPLLQEGQRDAYLEARRSDRKETVYEHCLKALARADRVGAHGLILIGDGDWNDGYSRVGAMGQGESVWLSQFLAMTYRAFAGVCEKMEDGAGAAHCLKRWQTLLEAVEEQGYDGGYYLRAYYDDGSPMGSSDRQECRIDSLPQSFAVFAGQTDRDRLSQGICQAYGALVEEENGIIRLFTPPFADDEQEPGYVKAYPPGVRENGGQYTHAAIWLAMATAKLGHREQFEKLTGLLNPILKNQNPELAQRYLLEPYYMAADIYTNPSAYGRGGWSIYTGAAGWYDRLLTEYYLGLRLEEGNPRFEPLFPGLYRGKLRLSYKGKEYGFSNTAVE